MRMSNEKQLEPILITKQRCCELGGLGMRTLEYTIARGGIETRLIGRRRLVVYRSLVKFLGRDHPSVSPSARKSQSIPGDRASGVS
jgi:hypothetical protein